MPALRVTLPLLAFLGGCGAHEIEHVVVAMLENRAFDHMLGWMTRGGEFGDTRVDGLKGGECNPIDVTKPDGDKFCVNDEALDVAPYDPCHGFMDTTERIFGCKTDLSPGTPCNDMKMTNGTATMSGFVAGGIKRGHDGHNELTMWPPEKVPIITTLAKEYALFDRFFCSHPGSTYPNRQFVLSGTAHGMTDTGDAVPPGGFPQKTLLRSFEEAGLDWRLYYAESLAWAIFMGDVQRESAKPNIKEMDSFYADAKKGTLPAFSFIEPRIAANHERAHYPDYGLPNSQHPVASVREGERWMKNIYEAVRNGPGWNKTLLVFTYDEHGGYYDHVPPPQTDVPSPDGICTKEGFDYTRLGIRVPTIAISPWISKGTLVHGPTDEQKPSPTSEYELSSIPATMRKLFPQLGGPLTKRDAWAASFEHLLGDTMRTDCPTKLPTVPPPHPGEMERQLELPIDEHAVGLIKVLCGLAPVEAAQDEGRPCGEGIETMRQFTPWVAKAWAAWHGAQ